MSTPSTSVALHGAGSGVAATVVMSAVMLAAGRLGLVGRQPPEAVVRRAGDLVGAEPRGRTAALLASAAHLGFGASVGAAYALLPLRRPGAAPGVLTALAVWASSYAGWVPALGALPRPDQDRSDRQAVLAVSHVVYGAVLGCLDERARRSR